MQRKSYNNNKRNMKKRPKLCLTMKLPVVLEHDTVARYKGITALAKPNILFLLLLHKRSLFISIQ